MTLDSLLNLLRARLAELRGNGATYRAVASRMRHADGRRYAEGTLANFGAGAPAGLGFADDLLAAFPELAAAPLPVCPTCGQLRRRDVVTESHRAVMSRRGPLRSDFNDWRTPCD